MKLSQISDDELLSRVSSLLGSERRVLARLLVHLSEVEERRLDLRSAHGSIFQFCIHHLGLSESEAYLRVTAARLVRRFPHILEKIDSGQIHLSALALLRNHITDANHQELVAMACGRTKREVQRLLAARFPSPDVPTRIRKLPSVASTAMAATDATATTAASPADGEPAATSTALPSATPPAAGGSDATTTERAAPPVARRAVVEALSGTRYKLQMTIDAELREKLERAQRLMSHSNPSGDLTVVLGRAMDLLIADLEKTKLAKTTRPRSAPAATKRAPTKPGYTTRAVRREVFARDNEQCTFVNEQGHRCSARSFLELDHIVPRAHGGTDEATNLRVRCRAHNHWYAEQVFGREHVERQVRLSQSKSRSRAGDGDSKDDSPSEPPAATSVDRALAMAKLKSMGIRRRDARRALRVVLRRLQEKAAPAPSLEEVVREALAVLA